MKLGLKDALVEISQQLIILGQFLDDGGWHSG
jgi:hypothetical protein